MSRLGRLFGGFRARGHAQESAAAPAVIQWVIAGLGNPGEEYGQSRHNLGFMTIRRLAASLDAELRRRKFGALWAEATIRDERAILVLPQRYYNLSGESLAAMIGYFKLEPGRLIVVHDDLDLAGGRLQLRRGGGDAGNRGIRSIIEALGTADFIRVRVGIGRPASGEESKDYVLSRPGGEESRALKDWAQRAGEAVVAIVGDGLERAMSRFNQHA